VSGDDPIAMIDALSEIPRTCACKPNVVTMRLSPADAKRVR